MSVRRGESQVHKIIVGASFWKKRTCIGGGRGYLAREGVLVSLEEWAGAAKRAGAALSIE